MYTNGEILKDKKKGRDTNFEILRIIAMIMILILHFNNFGKVLINVERYSMQYYIFNILEYTCIISVNLYVLITGYYMVKSKLKIKKIIELECEIIFYSLMIYILLVITKQIGFSLKSFITSALPVSTNKYWFMTAYMTLYLLIPFINLFIHNIKQADYRILLIVLTIILSVLGGLLPAKKTISYSLIWFIYLYLTAGYIRLYVGKIKNEKSLLIFGLVVLIQVIIMTLYNKFVNEKSTMLLTEYNNILILINSISVFLLFRDIKIKNNLINNIVLKISPLTLAVYLIHMHSNFFSILWNTILKPVQYLGSWKIYIALIVDVTLIFAISCIIEKIRRFLFDIIEKNKRVQELEEKIISLLKLDTLEKIQ